MAPCDVNEATVPSKVDPIGYVATKVMKAKGPLTATGGSALRRRRFLLRPDFPPVSLSCPSLRRSPFFDVSDFLESELSPPRRDFLDNTGAIGGGSRASARATSMAARTVGSAAAARERPPDFFAAFFAGVPVAFFFAAFLAGVTAAFFFAAFLVVFFGRLRGFFLRHLFGGFLGR